jgi:hypothetical protein
MNNNDNQFVFNPRLLNLRFWTIKVSRTGRGDFGGRLWCKEGIDGNVDKIIRQFVYEKREAGDKLLDLRDLSDIKDQVRFTIMKYDDRNDINHYRVNQILSFQGGFLVLKLGTVLYIRIDSTTHVQICNMLDLESGMAKLTWDVRQGKPRQITDEMYAIWDDSETFRQEHREEFQAATVNERYEPEQGAFAEALRVAETQKKGPQQWSPSEGSSTALHALPTPVEEMTLDDLEVAKNRKVPPTAPRRKAKEA